MSMTHNDADAVEKDKSKLKKERMKNMVRRKIIFFEIRESNHFNNVSQIRTKLKNISLIDS